MNVCFVSKHCLVLLRKYHIMYIKICANLYFPMKYIFIPVLVKNGLYFTLKSLYFYVNMCFVVRNSKHIFIVTEQWH